jgi:ATP-binding cassette subfamily F protein 3
MGSIDTLIEALSQFNGTMVFISHDVHFIRKIASHVIHVEQGKLRHYPGPYDYYLEKTGQQSARAAETSLTNGSPVKAPDGAKRQDAKTRKRREAEARQALSKKRKSQQAVIDKSEVRISSLEKRQGEIAGLLEQPETYSAGGQAQQLNRELMEINDELKQLNDRWSVAVDLLNAIT